MRAWLQTLGAFCVLSCTVLGDQLDEISDGNHCTSGVRDGDETDEDCGGTDCPACQFGSLCRGNSDCSTAYCQSEDDESFCACPPEMVSHTRSEDGRSFCIDKLEVSVGNYQAFLSFCAEKGGCESDCDGPWTIEKPVSNDASGGCTPDKFDPENQPNRPVVCVHLCDAFAYCKALGKRVCGDYFEDVYAVTSANDPDVSEWFNACSGSGELDFPYGENLLPAACNGSGGASANVGTFPGCGAGNGPLDMSGNVREWEAVYDEASDSCYVRGGSFKSNNAENELRCPATFPWDCGEVADDIGFRCCSG